MLPFFAQLLVDVPEHINASQYVFEGARDEAALIKVASVPVPSTLVNPVVSFERRTLLDDEGRAQMEKTEDDGDGEFQETRSRTVSECVL